MEREGTVTIMKTNRAAWVAGVGLWLGLDGAAMATNPAATLLLPEPGGFNSPAPPPPAMMFPNNSNTVPSSEVQPPNLNSPPANVAPVIEREARVQSSGAPSYPKPADPLNVGGVWRWLTGTDRPGAGNDKNVELVVNQTTVPSEVVRIEGHHGPAVVTAVAPVSAMPAQTPAATAQTPAWRWVRLWGAGARVEPACAGRRLMARSTRVGISKAAPHLEQFQISRPRSTRRCPCCRRTCRILHLFSRPLPLRLVRPFRLVRSIRRPRNRRRCCDCLRENG